MQKNLESEKYCWLLAVFLSFLFVVLICLHFKHIQESYNPDESQLTDNKSLENYLANKISNKILIPTGVFINSLSWLNAQTFYLSGIIWQKYPASYPDNLSLGIILPEAVESNIKEIYKIKQDNYTLIGWSFEGKINQRFNYSRYPFDNKIISLRLWPKDFSENIILSPDFISYESTKAEDNFGLDPEIVLGGYTILESFFRYREPKYDTNFGLATNAFHNTSPELYYNIALKRHILDAFIEHILPLLVVFLLCFSSLLSNTLNPKKREIYSFSYMETITQIAALFFVVLLAHIHLRENLVGAGVIYLEYLYIIAYLCIIYVTVNSFLVVHAELSDKIAYRIVKYKDNLIPKLIFLPLVSGLILVLAYYFY